MSPGICPGHFLSPTLRHRKGCGMGSWEGLLCVSLSRYSPDHHYGDSVVCGHLEPLLCGWSGGLCVSLDLSVLPCPGPQTALAGLRASKGGGSWHCSTLALVCTPRYTAGGVLGRQSGPVGETFIPKGYSTHGGFGGDCG